MSNDGNYVAPECEGYIVNRKISPIDMEERLMQAQLHINQGLLAAASAFLGSLHADLIQMPVVDEIKCNWEGGRVDAEFEGGKTYYTAIWNCPRCGSEGVQSRQVGDDDPDL